MSHRLRLGLASACLAVLLVGQSVSAQQTAITVDRVDMANPRYLNLKRDTKPIDNDIFELDKCCVPVNLFGTEWFDRWWSWATWWELNTQHHLLRKKDLQITNDDMAGAMDVLLDALEHKTDPKILEQVIYALARMKCKEAPPLIIPLIKHPNKDIRHISWIALGLIGDDAAKQVFLDVLDKPKLNDDDTCAWILGIGLMDKPDETLLKALLPIITQVNLLRINAGEADAHRNEAMPQARLAMWAMRMHNPNGINDLALKMLNVSTDPLLFDQCIQALATNLNEELTSKVLHPLYYRNPSGWRTMEAKAVGYSSFIYETPMSEFLTHDDADQQLASMRTSIAIAYDDMLISAKDKDKRVIKLINSQIKRMYSIMTESDRTGLTSHQASRKIQPRYFVYDHWHHRGGFCMCYPFVQGYARRYALIPLGRFGDVELKGDSQEPVDAQFLCDVLKMKYTLKKGQSELDPSRSFAAVALGLYLQRLPSDTTQIREDKLREMARYLDRLLTRIATDPDEPVNLRAACVLALGLGCKDDSVAYVVQTLPDPLVSSFASIALGLNNNPLAIKIVSDAYKKKADGLDVEKLRKGVKLDEGDTGKVYIQRNLLRGLAVLGDPNANTLIYPQLMKNRYASEEMIRTIKWTGDYAITESLIELLNDSGKQPKLEAFCAWALGELYDPNAYPVALDRMFYRLNPTVLPLEYNSRNSITEHGNPEIIYAPNIHMMRYFELADPFVFKKFITGKRG